jgi:hypothetical protein
MRRPRAPGVCAALALAAVGLGAVPAGAGISRPHRTLVVARVNGAAAADGGHFVAWGASDGLTVLDDRNGDTTNLALGRPCAQVHALDGSAGVFLIACRVPGAAGTETHQLVGEVDTATVTDLPTTTYSRIGRYWVQGRAVLTDSEEIVYTNWHTGETRLFRAPRAGQIYTPFDLDTPDLEPVALAGPEFVTGSSMALEQVRAAGGGYSIHLIGAETDRVVYRSARRSQLVSVKGGLALWRNGAQRLFGYAIRSRRRLEWRIGDSATVRGSTGRRVYYLTPKLADPQYSDLRSFAWR